MGVTYLYIHVDKIAIFGPDPTKFVEDISKKFKIKDLGPAALLLGMNVEQKTGMVHLSHNTYIDGLVPHYSLSSHKMCSTPFKPFGKLLGESKEELKTFAATVLDYRKLVGELNYIS